MNDYACYDKNAVRFSVPMFNPKVMIKFLVPDRLLSRRPTREAETSRLLRNICKGLILRGRAKSTVAIRDLAQEGHGIVCGLYV